jgi:hypothetical protein
MMLAIVQYTLHTKNFAKCKTLVQTSKKQGANIEKQRSSFTLLTICTMAILANFTYFRKLHIRTQDVVIKHHILVKGLMSKGGAMHAASFDFIINLNMPYWLSRSLTLKTSSTKVFTPSNNCVLLE